MGIVKVPRQHGPASQRARLSVFVIVLASAAAACGQVAFDDVTEAVGLTGATRSAVAWGDYNRDGWVDLYDGRSLWRNERGKRFVAVTGLPLGGSGVWGDFDNDGFLDLYSGSSGRLFRNVGGKTFADVSDRLPPRPMKVCRGAVWGDFDADGDLDLYVGGYEIWQKAVYPDVILRNDGNAFTQLRQTPGKPMSARGVTAADFDQDGDLDVYVSNYRLFPNLLWLNDGTGTFRNVAEARGVAGDGDLGAWGHTIGSAWGDLDADGHLDLFVGNFSHPPAYQDRPQFLKNLGPRRDWRFQDRSAKAGLRWQESYASPALADYDNDGDLDLFFTTVYAGDASVLYRNDGDWTFTDVTSRAAVATEKTYQAAWADYDNDGDLDLMSGGRLFRNPGGTNCWIKVRLEGGGKVNRAAIGAQVRIRLGRRTLTRQVEGATGEGNQNDLTLHFGLGSHTGPVELSVLWPDGSTQTVRTPTRRLVVVRKTPPNA